MNTLDQPERYRPAPSLRKVALGLAAATALAAVLGIVRVEPAAAKERVKATIVNGTLTITGTPDPDTLALRLRAGHPDTLQVDVGDNRSPDFAFRRDRFSGIAVNVGNGIDAVRIDDANGGFTDTEVTTLDGGPGNDTLQGGVGGEVFFGQAGDDTLQGGGGADVLRGGDDADVLTGGAGDDHVFGELGQDRMRWTPGDGSDLNEGGDGGDVVEVNGEAGGESFTATANGTRVRLDRLSPAPFALDIGTSEDLVVSMNGGDDSFAATGDLAALIKITVDGGEDADTILGSNGIDLLFGRGGDDFVDGQQGNDVAFLGAGNDTAQWDPGDGSDTLEGQDGTDSVDFNGSNGAEVFHAFRNGQRVLFTRNLGNIVLDFDGIEAFELNAFGNTDTTVVNDLTGTDLTSIDVDLAASLGGGDGLADTVIVNGSNGDDDVDVDGAGTSASVVGLSARVNIANAEVANDALVVNALGGGDRVAATALPAGVIKLTEDGGAGDDSLLGSQAADVFIAGDNDDTIVGDDGNDVALMGAGNDVFRWEPGDGNDTVEGQDGIDAMAFIGSDVAENIDVAANGGRVLVVRNVANVTMDLDDVEKLDVRALDGTDNVAVGDLSGTDLTTTDLDLNGPAGLGDGQADHVTVNGTQAADVFGASGDPAGIHVVGLGAAVNVVGQEHAHDRLTLNALAGDDVVDSTSLLAGGIQLTMNGGLGIDTILGSHGDDLVNGGDGNDVALLSTGDDLFVWNPGDDSDILEGQAGSDTMLFNGANVTENVTVSANGGRVLFFRDIANVTMDLNDVETADFRALGGADVIRVGDLTGTDLVDVDTALGAFGGGGDGQPDTVLVAGTNGDDAISVAGSNDSATVSGLPARVDVSGAEAADTLTVDMFAGDDAIESSGLAPGAIKLVANGGAGNDELVGGPAGEILRGGDDADVLTGGAGDDHVFGELGQDRMRWTPGDGSDLNEGGDGGDVVEVNGEAGGESFTATANGTRVRLDRLSPAPFALDIGTSEDLVVSMNGGDDSFAATGDLAALIKITVDGGEDADTILGSNGIDLLFGRGGDDFVDGQQGNDVAFLGAGNDTAQWDPGDGSDTLEGQDGDRQRRLQRLQRRRGLPCLPQRPARALHAQPRQHRARLRRDRGVRAERLRQHGHDGRQRPDRHRPDQHRRRPGRQPRRWRRARRHGDRERHGESRRGRRGPGWLGGRHGGTGGARAHRRQRGRERHARDPNPRR